MAKITYFLPMVSWDFSGLLGPMMTESEWLTSTDPVAMLAVLRERGLDVQALLVHSYVVAGLKTGTGHANILRDVFGNPFRPMLWRSQIDKLPAYTYKPDNVLPLGSIPVGVLDDDILAWSDSTVPNLAQTIYDEVGERECKECQDVIGPNGRKRMCAVAGL